MAKLDYQDQIQRQLNKAKKARIAEAVVYYWQAFRLSACASFETFKGSWAYEQWVKKNALAIAEEEKSLRRGW